MSRRAKPKSPDLILTGRARDFATVGLQPEGAHLPANANIEVRRRTLRSLTGARRVDAFDALREGMAKGAYDAVRRLEEDLMLRGGQPASSGGGGMERIDCAAGAAVADTVAVNRLDRALAAGRRVDRVMSRVGPRDALLLGELITPVMAGRPWREVVRMVTGEDNPVAQAAVVRAACANLAMAYQVRASAA
jgi:hypothetical protein